VPALPATILMSELASLAPARAEIEAGVVAKADQQTKLCWAVLRSNCSLWSTKIAAYYTALDKFKISTNV
jgi:hypothetical protein